MNKDFIDILREIRGSGQPGVPYTNGIWYELTMADTNGNPGIYGDILAKYGVLGDNADQIQIIANNMSGIIAVVAAINAGVDFEEVMNLIASVDVIEDTLLTKVDKVPGSSLMTAEEHTKLQNIMAEATKNQTDAYLLARENHTGTQDLDTTTDSVTRLAMTAAERNKLKGIADNANAYTHPTKHSATIIDGTGEFNKVLKTDESGVVGFGTVSWSEVSGKPSTMTPSAHEHSMDEITSGTIAAARVVVSEGRQFITAEQATALLDMEMKSNKGTPLGYVPLDANGKINPSFLNDLNLIEVFTPADLSSMLNLNSAQPGDIAYRLDTNNTYMLAALPVNVEANWKQLNAGLSVVSVNGLSGVVNVNTANIPEGGSNYYYTNERVDDRVATLLKAGTNVSLSYDDILGELTISANDTSINWSEIQSKPTTVAGYGITDAYAKSEVYAKTETYTKTEVQTTLPKIGLNTSNVTAPSTGQIAWNQDERTIDVGVNGVTLQVGQEQLVNVRNSSGATILNKTVVMMTGTIGARGRLTVAPFDGSDAKKILGIATEDFANGADGFATTFGKVRGVDTSAWVDGDILYATTGGGLTNVMPTTGVNMPIAVVVNSHASAGTLFVRVNPLDMNAFQPASSALTALTRADKYLAAQNIANMLYSSGNLVKIQYNTATDVDYEVLSYSSGKLVGVAHFVDGVLKGNTVLSYSGDTLIAAVFTGV